MSPSYSDNYNILCSGSDAEDWKHAMSSCNTSTFEDPMGMGLYRQLCEDSIWMSTNNRSYEKLDFGKEFGYVPCKGYRSSQLIYWESSSGIGPESHLCNGILDCIDRSDETGCQDPLGSSEVNEGIKMKIRRQPRIAAMGKTDCKRNFTFEEIYKGRCETFYGEDDPGCDSNITLGRHESQCSKSEYDNFTSTFIELG